MRTVDEWKSLLRAALRDAQRARDADSVSMLRETIAAIENAEAPDISVAGYLLTTPAGQSEVIAGAVDGAGAGEIARRVLSPEEVAGIIERELVERRAAADSYASLGRHDEADVLRLQADMLEALRG